MNNHPETSSAHPFLQTLVCCGMLALILWGCVGAMQLCADLLRLGGQSAVLQPVMLALGE